MAMRRPCIGNGNNPCPTAELSEPGRTRCAHCQQQYDHDRNTSRPQYHGNWARQAKREIAHYRDACGDTCPGWDRAPHPIDPDQWTCDHDIGPLCRSCNSRKGATHDKARHR